jgi:hypothetical protein
MSRTRFRVVRAGRLGYRLVDQYGRVWCAPHPNKRFMHELCTMLNTQAKVRAERRATREAEAAMTVTVMSEAA